jgi:chemotaxis response regulator CheB
MKVYVVEDSDAICERLVRMVNEVKDTQIVGAADEVSAATDGIEKCQTEVVTYLHSIPVTHLHF